MHFWPNHVICLCTLATCNLHWLDITEDKGDSHLTDCIRQNREA